MDGADLYRVADLLNCKITVSLNGVDAQLLGGTILKAKTLSPAPTDWKTNAPRTELRHAVCALLLPELREERRGNHDAKGVLQARQCELFWACVCVHATIICPPQIQGYEEDDLQVILEDVEARENNMSLHEVVLRDIPKWNELVDTTVWIYRSVPGCLGPAWLPWVIPGSCMAARGHPGVLQDFPWVLQDCPWVLHGCSGSCRTALSHPWVLFHL